jgi:pantothenate kinase
MIQKLLILEGKLLYLILEFLLNRGSPYTFNSKLFLQKLLSIKKNDEGYIPDFVNFLFYKKRITKKVTLKKIRFLSQKS